MRTRPFVINERSCSDRPAVRVPALLRVEVSYAAGVHNGPLTGRLFLAVNQTADPEPRIAAYNSARQRDGRVPFFATDVTDVERGETMVIDVGADGYPYARLGELPAGDYWVQALVHKSTLTGRIPTDGASPTHGVRVRPTHVGHRLEYVAREQCLGRSPARCLGSQALADNRLVSEQRVLNAGLLLVA